MTTDGRTTVTAYDEEPAWRAWARRLAFRLADLGHGDALFVVPERARPPGHPLEGPSLRMLRWADGPVAVIARLPESVATSGPLMTRMQELGWRDVGSGRAVLGVRRGSEPDAAISIARVLSEVFGCIHPSFVLVGGPEAGPDAAIWHQVVMTRLIHEAGQQRGRAWLAHGAAPRRWSAQLPLFDVADPSTPTLWD